MSGNNTFETPDFADLRFSFRSSKGCLTLLHSVLMEKVIAKHYRNDFVFSFQRVCLFPPFDWRKIKEQVAGRRTSWIYKLIFESTVFMKPAFIDSNTNCSRPSEIP